MADKDSIVILFGSEATGNAALEDIEKRIPENELGVRVVETSHGHPQPTQGTVAGVPVPPHGGVVPMFVGIADLDISDEERDYIFNRATTDMMILEIKTLDQYMDTVKQIATMHNGQFYDEEQE